MSEDCNHSHEREIEHLYAERDNALLEAERWKRELLRKIENCGCDGQAYLDIRAERDAARDSLERLRQRNNDLDDERSRTLDNARLHEAERDAALMRVEEAQAAVAAMTVEIADLQAAAKVAFAAFAKLADDCRALVAEHDSCDGCSLSDELYELVGERSAVTTAGDDADRLIDSILREPS